MVNRFSINLRIIIKERRLPQWRLAYMLYRTREDYATRKIRRLMNGKIRPTLDVVIKYARVLNVDASDLAFGTDGMFSPYVEVEDRFSENMRMYANQYKTYQLARRLYPNKRVVDVNDGRKLRRLVQGVTQPRMDDIVNLAGGLGISPGKLSFGVL